MTTRIVVLGAGTGGTLAANRLRQCYPAGEVEIVVVDQDDSHLYQPGLLFVPFGRASVEGITRSRRRQLRDGVGFRQAVVDRVDTSASRVFLDGGRVLDASRIASRSASR